MKKRLSVAIICLILFVVLMVLLKKIDVQAIGPLGSEIGFATFNGAVHNIIGEHPLIYKYFNWLGLLSYVIAAHFAFLGLYQWIKRKNIFKVDPEIIGLGVLYAIIIAIYFVFEKVVINYRPLIMAGETELESSFPSSHTITVLIICCTALMIFKKYIKNEKIRKGLNILFFVVMIVNVFCRIASGVHWATDIIGGLLLTIGLSLLYYVFIYDILKADY